MEMDEVDLKIITKMMVHRTSGKALEHVSKYIQLDIPEDTAKRYPQAHEHSQAYLE